VNGNAFGRRGFFQFPRERAEKRGSSAKDPAKTTAGTAVSPSIDATLVLVTRDEAIRRLKTALEKLA